MSPEKLTELIGLRVTPEMKEYVDKREPSPNEWLRDLINKEIARHKELSFAEFKRGSISNLLDMAEENIESDSQYINELGKNQLKVAVHLIKIGYELSDDLTELVDEYGSLGENLYKVKPKDER